MKIAIIGTAGRKEDAVKMTRALYLKMVDKSWEVVDSLSSTDSDLVSGGAAWSDHCAVSLYLMGVTKSLTIYMPSFWDSTKEIFIGNSSAKTANYYHKIFSKELGGNTLHGIQKAINRGATYHEIQKGFKARNLLVGDVDTLIAFTWGEGDTPKNGGTSHTWYSSNASIKIHVPLSSL